MALTDGIRRYKSKYGGYLVPKGTRNWYNKKNVSGSFRDFEYDVGRTYKSMKEELKLVDFLGSTCTITGLGTVAANIGGLQADGLHNGVSNGTPPFAANVTCVNCVAIGTNGTDMFNRDNRRIRMAYGVFTCAISLSGVGNTTSTSELCRIMIVYDKQNNGTAPLINELLQESGSNNSFGTTQSADVQSGYNIQNSKRFKVLYDKFIHSAKNSTGAYDGTIDSIVDYNKNNVNIYETIDLAGMETCFNCTGPAGTTNAQLTATISTGGLFVVTMGSCAAGTTGGLSAYQYQANWKFRLRFRNFFA